MASFNEENDFKKEAGVPDGHYFYLGGKQVEDYCTSLFHLGDIKPFAPVVFKIYYECDKHRKQSSYFFHKFEVIDDENFVCYPEK